MTCSIVIYVCFGLFLWSITRGDGELVFLKCLDLSACEPRMTCRVIFASVYRRFSHSLDGPASLAKLAEVIASSAE